MDLPKIIADLRLELQTIKAAIASLESLDRIPRVPDSVPRRAVAATTRTAGESAPAKRPRGRPRKHPLPVVASRGAAAPSPDDDPESSTA